MVVPFQHLQIEVLRRPLKLPEHPIRYTERLEEAVIPASVGTGDSYDNAPAETINGLYKTN